MSHEPTRRDILMTTAGLALGALARPASAFQGSPVILGSGSHRYECLHDWIKPPEGLLFGDTHGLAQDRQGRIYVSHTVNGNSQRKEAVCVYDERGKFLSAWGEAYRGGAHGLDIRQEGNEEFLYHCDTKRRVVEKTTLDGKVIWSRGIPEESAAYRYQRNYVPTNVAFGPDGDFYIADGYGSSWIHQFDIKGNFKRTFAGPGSDAGKTSCPHGLWVDTRGSEPLLVVADRSNRRLQYFSLDGKHVRFVKDGMRLPCHFSQYQDLLLVPDLESVVTILDAQNRVVVHLGDGHPSSLRDRPRSEFINGRFVHPHDAIFLRNGDILVAEWVPIGRVTLLRRVRE